eukprot:4803217-Pyramimonas_sp.AAC.1
MIALVYYVLCTLWRDSIPKRAWSLGVPKHYASGSPFLPDPLPERRRVRSGYKARGCGRGRSSSRRTKR